MSLSMEFENVFSDNEFVDLIFSDVPMTTLLPSCSDKAVESWYSTEPLASRYLGNRMAYYSSNSVPSSCCSDSGSSRYGSESISGESVTSPYDGESASSSFRGESLMTRHGGELATSVTSRYGGESVTSSFSAESVTSCYGGELVPTSFSGESVASSGIGESVTSPFSSLSDTLNSYCEFDEMLSGTVESDDSFSDLINYDDVFEPIATTEVENTPKQQDNSEIRASRSLCHVGRPALQHAESQPGVTYTPRYTHNSNNGCPKPKRKRSQNTRQRSAANVRERNRMVYLNKAFNVLKSKLPGLNNKRLSRIDTLRTAISYIKCMKDITS